MNKDLDKIPTWQKSLKKVGSFGIRGILESVKSADDMAQELVK